MYNCFLPIPPTIFLHMEGFFLFLPCPINTDGRMCTVSFLPGLWSCTGNPRYLEQNATFQMFWSSLDIGTPVQWHFFSRCLTCVGIFISWQTNSLVENKTFIPSLDHWGGEEGWNRGERRVSIWLKGKHRKWGLKSTVHVGIGAEVENHRSQIAIIMQWTRKNCTVTWIRRLVKRMTVDVGQQP